MEGPRRDVVLTMEGPRRDVVLAMEGSRWDVVLAMWGSRIGLVAGDFGSGWLFGFHVGVWFRVWVSSDVEGRCFWFCLASNLRRVGFCRSQDRLRHGQGVFIGMRAFVFWVVRATAVQLYNHQRIKVYKIEFRQNL